MKRDEARSCLGGCGATFNRPKSMPLCRLASDLVYARLRQLPLRNEFNARSRRSNHVWSHEAVVVALLAGDLIEAQRIIDGLYPLAVVA